eukprot:CAMPEP_0202861714 /NCGR_PEP_ID=MMETSP1391-20130828/3007_1 /ASSEMBLY_ACC=CAM_ASM_000867 /TAXON_ID=1034604 /ORGANISM="Chlamydomonas leiostraca, Strain SAG 11-49" /LENGTH=120 /DNA_ID=CAMNT_0049541143 /DNA_START=45 /DNA_END=407 /DNA_ORIENTATION=+
MQTVASRVSAKRVAAVPARRVAVAARPLRVVCQAQRPAEIVKKAAAAMTVLPALVAAHPAFALVDERLNGDGTGKPFGINDSILGFVIVGVLTTIWAIWFNGQKDLGDFEDPDAGLKIDQ